MKYCPMVCVHSKYAYSVSVLIHPMTIWHTYYPNHNSLYILAHKVGLCDGDKSKKRKSKKKKSKKRLSSDKDYEEKTWDKKDWKTMMEEEEEVEDTI